MQRTPRACFLIEVALADVVPRAADFERWAAYPKLKPGWLAREIKYAKF